MQLPATCATAPRYFCRPDGTGAVVEHHGSSLNEAMMQSLVQRCMAVWAGSSSRASASAGGCLFCLYEYVLSDRVHDEDAIAVRFAQQASHVVAPAWLDALERLDGRDQIVLAEFAPAFLTVSHKARADVVSTVLPRAIAACRAAVAGGVDGTDSADALRAWVPICWSCATAHEPQDVESNDGDVAAMLHDLAGVMDSVLSLVTGQPACRDAWEEALRCAAAVLDGCPEAAALLVPRIVPGLTSHHEGVCQAAVLAASAVARTAPSDIAPVYEAMREGVARIATRRFGRGNENLRNSAVSTLGEVLAAAPTVAELVPHLDALLDLTAGHAIRMQVSGGGGVTTLSHCLSLPTSRFSPRACAGCFRRRRWRGRRGGGRGRRKRSERGLGACVGCPLHASGHVGLYRPALHCRPPFPTARADGGSCSALRPPATLGYSRHPRGYLVGGNRS